ncbi:MAG: hypothetical protein LBS03_06990 [Bacteroidales bacterium]|jgi:hypothetical protein|nr:hypothetical protein [Bacteroidales bacterium]
MKHIIKKSITVATAIALMIFCPSCGDNHPDGQTYLNVSAKKLLLPPNGGAVLLGVDTDTDDWTFSLTDGEWLESEKTSGGIRLTATANDRSPETQTATLSVSSVKAGAAHTITVEQASAYVPYLHVADSRVEVPAGGGNTTVMVETNTTDWTFAVNGGNGWLSGEKKPAGLLLTATQNANPEGPRTAVLQISSPSSYLIINVTVSQTSTFSASLTLSEESPFAVAPAGGESTIVVTASISDWTVESSETWLVAEKTIEGNVRLTFSQNVNEPLSADVIFASASFPEVNRTLAVTQAVATFPDDGKTAGFVYFEDDFSWISVTFGQAVDDEVFNWKYAGTPNACARNIDTYGTAVDIPFVAGDMRTAYINHGYNDVNPNPQVTYFCKDYLKFGKTNYQGGFWRSVSGIDAGKQTDLLMEFDALPVKTGSDNYDNTILNVLVEGSGATEANGFAKVAVVDISDHVDKQLPFEWQLERDHKVVRLYGITADTKIYVKTNLSGDVAGTYRFYLDNLKFTKMAN